MTQSSAVPHIRALINSFNEATAAIPCWDKYAESGCVRAVGDSVVEVDTVIRDIASSLTVGMLTRTVGRSPGGFWPWRQN